MIKPEFFDDPDIADLSPFARLLFIGMWIQADREGRLSDDLRRLKARIFPYDTVDIHALAVELQGKNMVRHYQDTEKHGFFWIRTFTKHQRPHPKEPQSVIPPFTNETCKETASNVVGTASRVKDIPNPSESGVLILDSGSLESGSLDSGIRNLGSGGARASADADFMRFCDAYPVSRRITGKKGRSAFKSATTGRNGTHLAAMLDALAQQKRSEQWQTPKLIPLMTTWLNQERWNQTLPESTRGLTLNQISKRAVPGWICSHCHEERPLKLTECHCGEKRHV